MTIKEENLLDYTRRAIKHYGQHVNEDRAFPDFKDGFKPVQRRAMWALSHFPSNTLTKTARLVGDILGKYHPHGDVSCAGAIETLVNSPTSPIHGEGNWGTLEDNAAAMRYTNVRFSEYGKTFFNKDYMAVTPLLPNYDGKDTEPLVVPSLLPNVLFNGGDGIGFGIAGRLPTYTPVSVIGLCIRLLNGEQLATKDYLGLEFQFKYGGRPAKTKQNRADLLAFYQSNTGSILLVTDLKNDPKNHCFVWDEFPPGITPKSTEAKAKAKGKTGRGGSIDKLLRIPGVKSIQNTTNKKDKNISYAINYDRGVAKDEEKLAALKKACEKVLQVRRNFIVNVTDRHLDDKGNLEVEFHETTVPDLIKMWLKWRVRFEKTSLENRIKLKKAEIAYIQLMMLAADSLDIIIKGLRSDDPDAYLVKHMKITAEQAKQILDRQVRSLSKLSKSNLEADLKKQRLLLKELETWLSKPVKKVIQDMTQALTMFQS